MSTHDPSTAVAGNGVARSAWTQNTPQSPVSVQIVLSPLPCPMLKIGTTTSLSWSSLGVSRYYQIPVITRVYLTLALATTLLCALDLVSPFSLYFNWNAIVYKFEVAARSLGVMWCLSMVRPQVWRLVTNFLFFGLFGIEYVFHMFFLWHLRLLVSCCWPVLGCSVRYCRLLEENIFYGRSADFLLMLLFGGTVMTVRTLYTSLIWSTC